MTIINFKVDEKKKKRIEEITRLKGYKSISEFIREAIDDKMNLQKIIDDFKKKNPPFDKSKIDIPDFIPDGKYLGISRNTIVVIGDTLQEVVQKLFKKFPESAAGVMRKGKEIESFETIYSLFSLENTKCYHQVEISGNFYPFLEFSIIINGEERSLLGLIDTGATIMTLDKKFVNEYNIKSFEKTKVLTANGIIEASIYKCKFRYENQIIELKTISSDVSGPLAIQALVGKNFIDKFNLMFLGKEKLFCLQTLY